MGKNHGWSRRGRYCWWVCWWRGCHRGRARRAVHRTGGEGPGLGWLPTLRRKRWQTRLPESVAKPTTQGPWPPRKAPGHVAASRGWRLSNEGRSPGLHALLKPHTRGSAGVVPAGNTHVCSNVTSGRGRHRPHSSTWRRPGGPPREEEEGGRELLTPEGMERKMWHENELCKRDGTEF